MKRLRSAVPVKPPRPEVRAEPSRPKEPAAVPQSAAWNGGGRSRTAGEGRRRRMVATTGAAPRNPTACGRTTRGICRTSGAGGRSAAFPRPPPPPRIRVRRRPAAAVTLAAFLLGLAAEAGAVPRAAAGCGCGGAGDVATVPAIPGGCPNACGCPEARRDAGTCCCAERVTAPRGKWRAGRASANRSAGATRSRRARRRRSPPPHRPSAGPARAAGRTRPGRSRCRCESPPTARSPPGRPPRGGATTG